MKNKILTIIIVALALSLSGCYWQKAAKEVEINEIPVPIQREEDKSMNTANEPIVEEPEEEASSYVDISAEEAKEMIDNNPYLIVIDVSPHYDNGHLPGAVNYYLGDGSLDKAIPGLNKDAKYLVYCHVDSVSILGAQKLIDAGFKNVYRLKGNYQAWVDAGYPIEK